MRVRSFALQDYYGNTYSLDDPEGTGFLTDPKGLGYEDDYSYIDIGDAFIRTKSKKKQSEISGTLIFGGASPYRQYENFNYFVRSSNGLKLVYKMPHSDIEYYRDVDLVSVDKSEMSQGVLQIPVKFMCTSLFYSNIVNNFTVTSVDGELRYTIQWPARYNDYSGHSVSLNNNGDVAASFTCTIEGYCENPTIALMYNGEIVNSVTFPMTLQEGEMIAFSTLDDNLYAYFIGTDGTRENIVQLLDINNNNFFKIPVGDYEIRFTSDTGATFTTALAMYKFYRTV